MGCGRERGACTQRHLMEEEEGSRCAQICREQLQVCSEKQTSLKKRIQSLCVCVKMFQKVYFFIQLLGSTNEYFQILFLLKL